jgi:hypothetical protein|eukprot:g5363.t1
MSNNKSDNGESSASPPEAEDVQLNKTAKEYEQEIQELVVDASKAAMEANYYKSASILKRASVVSRRFHGGQSLEFAGILGKLSAMQDALGKPLEARMTWERALFIWEINRVGRVKKVHEDPGQKKMLAKVSPVKVQRNLPAARKGAYKTNLSLQELFELPHQTMQHADGRILYAKPIKMCQMNARAQEVLKRRRVHNPNLLRVRDFHSFFLAHPKISADMRKKYFVRWCQRREILMKELLEDLEVTQLQKESDARLELMREKVALEAEARKAKFFGLTNVKTDGFVGPKSVMKAKYNSKFRGSAAAAIDQMALAPVFCPACKTPWDFKHEPCRVCKKTIDWNQMQQDSHYSMTQKKIFLERKERLQKARREREDKKLQAAMDWEYKKAKSKIDKARALEYYLLAKRRAGKNPGSAAHIPIPEILRKKEPTAYEKAQRKAPALFKAVKMGDLAKVKTFLDEGVSPDTRDVNKWTLLHYASIRGYLEIVKVLIAAGAEVETLTKDIQTPLDLASTAGHGPVMKVLRVALSESVLYDPLSDEELIFVHQLRENKRPCMDYTIYKGERGTSSINAKIADRIFHGRHKARSGLALQPSDKLAPEWRMLLGIVSKINASLDADEGAKKEAMKSLAEAEERIKEKKQLEDSKNAVIEDKSDTHIAVQPSGYAYPLLSTFLVQNRDMRTKFGIVPANMSSEENLLRALDKMTRPEVKNGKRRHLNPVSKRVAGNKKKMLRTLYLHDLDHKKPKPKKVKTVTSDDWQVTPRKPKPPPTWVDHENNAFQYKERQIELLMHTLHEAQYDDGREMQKIKSIDDPKYRKEMYQYAVMKSAKKRDEINELMEKAGILTIPQEINSLLATQKMDAMMSKIV